MASATIHAGICGTGLISAIDAYLDLEVIDDTGAMEGTSVQIGDSPISITQADVRKLQLAKAAIAAGIDTLLYEAGLNASDVHTLHLAGGFGSYLQAQPAAGIGLIPEALVDKASPAGNTALTGAVLLTLSRTARKVAEERATGATEVGLSTHEVWTVSYTHLLNRIEDIGTSPLGRFAQGEDAAKASAQHGREILEASLSELDRRLRGIRPTAESIDPISLDEAEDIWQRVNGSRSSWCTLSEANPDLLPPDF